MLLPIYRTSELHPYSCECDGIGHRSVFLYHFRLHIVQVFDGAEEDKVACGGSMECQKRDILGAWSVA